MAELDWLDFETGPGGFGFGDVGADYSSGSPYQGYGYDPGPWLSNAAPAMDYSGWSAGGPGSFGNQVTTDYANGPNDTGGGGGGGGGGGMPSWLSSILGAVGPLAKQFGGPAASVIGSLTNAGRGSQAAQTAGQQQSQALNRGIDLQTAQWLQQQRNLAPYLQAGQGGLAQLQQLAGREQPGLPGATPAYTGGGVPLPSSMPGWAPRDYQGPQGPGASDYRWNPQAGPQAQGYRWQPGQLPQASQYNYEGPQAVQAGDYRWTPGQGAQAQDYRWTPGQGPRAQDYRYAPGQTPDAANYRYTPGAVPTLSGQELLANDPGVAFRMAEGRKALEASAAARGGLLSGGAMAALQRQGQELSSQEYAQAFGRASQQAQLREQWGQAASQMGFGQAMDASRLREQLQQYATQQGWSQGQTEAVFREQMAQQASQQGFGQAQTEASYRDQMAQQASQQGFNQALSAQGQQFQQGFANRQYDWQRAQAEATLREQINQQASQQGWTQAQAEAAFREQQGQLASQQGWNQALAGQQNQFSQGLQADQWSQQQRQRFETDLYGRLMEQNKLQYGRDVYGNETDYTRQQALYRQQLGQYMLPWEQQSTLANLGGQATGMAGQQGQNATNAISELLGQLGQAQGGATLGSALAQNQGTTTTANSLASVLSRLNA